MTLQNEKSNVREILFLLPTALIPSHKSRLGDKKSLYNPKPRTNLWEEGGAFSKGPEE
jgi:hypothetical protein